MSQASQSFMEQFNNGPGYIGTFSLGSLAKNVVGSIPIVGGFLSDLIKTGEEENEKAFAKRLQEEALAEQKSTNAFNKEMAEKNLAMQQEVFSYQKGLQEQLFNREDDAVQRRALDLEKAGLSKTLAAGSTGYASAPVEVTTPQYKYTDPGVASVLMSYADLINDMRQTSINAELVNAQSRLFNAQANNIDLQTSLDAEYSASEREANLAKDIANTVYLTDYLFNESVARVNQMVSSTDLNYANIEKMFSDIGLNNAQIKQIQSYIDLNASHGRYYNQLTENEKAKFDGIGYLNFLYNLQGLQAELEYNASAQNKEYYDFLGVPYSSSGTPVYSQSGAGIGVAGLFKLDWQKRVAVSLDTADATEYYKIISKAYDYALRGNVKGLTDFIEQSMGKKFKENH